MLTDSNSSKFKKYQYYVGGGGYGRRSGSRAHASKENYLPQPGAHVYTMPQPQRLLTESKKMDDESVDYHDREQQQKIQQLEERYENMLEKTRYEFAAFQGILRCKAESMRKVEAVLEDKDQTISELKQQLEKERSVAEAQLRHELECHRLEHAILLQERMAEKDERIQHLHSKLEDATNRYEKLLHDTATELQLGRQTNQSIVSRLRGQHQRERQQLQETITELEEKNSRLMKELYSDQNEIRMLKQELQAVRMLKEIEIAQLKSIYSRASDKGEGSVTKFTTPRTTYQQPTKLFLLEKALQNPRSNTDECQQQLIRKQLTPTP